MIPALIILALWVVLLAPGAVRWFREHQPTTSVASFHRQLRLLEHTGPKIVEPAYRLDGEDEPVVERDEAPRPAQRPRLVLLTTGPQPKESTMRYGDRYGAGPEDRYDDAESWDDPWGAEAPAQGSYDPPTRAQRTVRAPRDADYDRYDDYEDDGYVEYAPRRSSRPAPMAPDRAAHRRHRILVGLGATIAATFVLGLLPGLGILWAVTFVSILATVTYLGLMLYASNAGLYGTAHGSHARQVDAQPIARVVMPTFQDHSEDYADDYDDGWGQVAAAR